MHSKSESSASAERLTRLEDDLRLSQVDAQSSLARRMVFICVNVYFDVNACMYVCMYGGMHMAIMFVRMINQELEKTLQELQRAVREKELANGQLNDALRSALDAKQKAEMDREVKHIAIRDNNHFQMEYFNDILTISTRYHE